MGVGEKPAWDCDRKKNTCFPNLYLQKIRDGVSEVAKQYTEKHPFIFMHKFLIV